MKILNKLDLENLRETDETRGVQDTQLITSVSRAGSRNNIYEMKKCSS